MNRIEQLLGEIVARLDAIESGTVPRRLERAITAKPAQVRQRAEWQEEPPARILTLQEVKSVLVELQQRTSFDRAISVLRQVGGVIALAELPEEKRNAVVAAARRIKK